MRPSTGSASLSNASTAYLPQGQIVEDEGLLALDLRSRLKDLGYVVACQAADGSEAVEMARETAVDLVLMDIHLGEGPDGIDTADFIWKELALPVAFVTAHSDEPTLQRAKLSEPFGYVLKPFRDRDLQTAIEMALYKHRTQLELKRLVRQLQEALEQVKTLRGFLPICMHCKKIRDDEGYWTAVEEYVAKHSDVKFSHGVCQECFTRLYPDA